MNPIVRAIYSNRNYQFYLFQLAFWVGLMLFTFFSLTLWYNSAELAYILHTTVQAVLGVLVSFPLRNFYRRIWEKSALYRTCVTLLTVILVSAIWTVLRMMAFIWIVHEDKNLWLDFGGWYFGSFFIFFCWTSLYYGARYYSLMQIEHRKVLQTEAEKQQEHNKRLQAEAVAREAQLKMLRYQLNPHFLFNTLNAIYALIRTKDNQTAQEMVQKLSKFLRYSLDNDPSHHVDLDKELEALMLYLDIERTRFGDRLKLHLDISDLARPALIPSFLLQPLVENSIKYAISPSEEGGSIGINASVEDGNLLLEVWDDGPGIHSCGLDLPQGRGVGLRNTLDRLKILYADRQNVQLVNSEPAGLRIKIRFPYEPAQPRPKLFSQTA